MCKRYNIDPENVIRPFWPGGDYEKDEYPPGCVVVDNPPFSILKNICEFYLERGILFFCLPRHHGIIRQDYLGQNEPYYMRLHDRVRKRGNCEDIVYYQLRTGNGSGDITGADKAGE